MDDRCAYQLNSGGCGYFKSASCLVTLLGGDQKDCDGYLPAYRKMVCPYSIYYKTSGKVSFAATFDAVAWEPYLRKRAKCIPIGTQVMFTEFYKKIDYGSMYDEEGGYWPSPNPMPLRNLIPVKGNLAVSGYMTNNYCEKGFVSGKRHVALMSAKRCRSEDQPCSREPIVWDNVYLVAVNLRQQIEVPIRCLRFYDELAFKTINPPEEKR